jgi:hypothetical protein
MECGAPGYGTCAHRCCQNAGGRHEDRNTEGINRQEATGKRKPGETPTPWLAKKDIEIEVGNQKPYGLILDGGDDDVYYRSCTVQRHQGGHGKVKATKIHKYRALRKSYTSDTQIAKCGS